MSTQQQNTGSWGEKVALDFLLSEGYKVLERNFRALRGEIDLIVERAGVVVFVEVKSGLTSTYGPPEERVTLRKQRQIYRVAQAYIERFEGNELHDYRVDVIAVDGNRERFVIRHYMGAFYL